MVIVECDGVQSAVAEESSLVEAACREAGATQVRRAANEAERERCVERPAAALAGAARNRIAEDQPRRRRATRPGSAIARCRERSGAPVSSSRRVVRSAGDGNIHVNLMVDKSDADELKRARSGRTVLFERVVALEGSISGEHGIGFAKRPYLSLELSADRDRAHETREGRIRSGRHSESGENISVGGWWLVVSWTSSTVIVPTSVQNQRILAQVAHTNDDQSFKGLQYLNHLEIALRLARRGRSATRDCVSPWLLRTHRIRTDSRTRRLRVGRMLNGLIASVKKRERNGGGLPPTTNH